MNLRCGAVEHKRRLRLGGLRVLDGSVGPLRGSQHLLPRAGHVGGERLLQAADVVQGGKSGDLPSIVLAAQQFLDLPRHFVLVEYLSVAIVSEAEFRAAVADVLGFGIASTLVDDHARGFLHASGKKIVAACCAVENFKRAVQIVGHAQSAGESELLLRLRKPASVLGTERAFRIRFMRSELPERQQFDLVDFHAG